MARETKSNGQKDVLDRFYTKENIVDLCLKELSLNDYDCIIEPSAGNGSFSKKILNCIAYDIEPQDDSIQKQDWFLMDKKIFTQYKNILVVGNPPFGQQNTLAIAFFNESAKFANTIAFIFPRSFKKDSIKNRLDLNFDLRKEIDLLDCAFMLKGENEYKVPCVFQIWDRNTTPRKKKRLKTTTELFDFTTKENADFRIQRVGGNAGKASKELNYSAESNYFIKNKSQYSIDELITIINNLKFLSIEFTVGPKSLSKGELIATLEEELL